MAEIEPSGTYRPQYRSRWRGPVLVMSRFPWLKDHLAKLVRRILTRVFEPGLITTVLSRKPVEDEEARRDRPALPVDGVEIAGAAEPVSALHRRTLSRELLPAPGPPALEDRATRARRHPRAEAVAALPPTHVWLVGPLQGRCKEGEKRGAQATPGHQYSRPSSTRLSTAREARLAAEDLRHKIVSTSVESRVDARKGLQISRLFGTKAVCMLGRSPISNRAGRIAGASMECVST